ncbi:hypothetical protein DENSPDRAFT_175371 [Dentipellis sp. KUC8613]|nr:hypothetical protein DENSPDRAFT_175371 [Dentipellis sp. KUC8613]
MSTLCVTCATQANHDTVCSPELALCTTTTSLLPATASATRHPRIPIELVEPIMEYLSQMVELPDFAKLVSLTSAWRYEVERVLYKFIDIPDRGILLFCDVMEARAKDLAPRVRRISFAGLGHRDPRPGDAQRVADMLGLLTGLKNLVLLDPPRDSRESKWIFRRTDYYIVDQVSLDLERFRTVFKWCEQCVDFIAKRPKIRELIFRGESYLNTMPTAPPGLLANCTTLQATPHVFMTLKNVARNLTHVRLDIIKQSMEDEQVAAECIAHMGAKLRVLGLFRLIDLDEDYTRTSHLLRIILPHTPNLVFLRLREAHDYSRRENKKILELVSKNLRKLVVFVWGPLSLTFYADDDFESDGSGFSMDSDDEEDSKSKIYKYGMRVAKAVPTLELFVADRNRYTEAWIRSRVTGQWRTMTQQTLMWADTFRCIDPDDPVEFALGSHRYGFPADTIVGEEFPVPLPYPREIFD